MAKRFFGVVNIGTLITITGVLVGIPLLILPFYPNETRYWHAFAIPCVVSVVLGVLIWYYLKGNDDVTHWRVNMERGSLTVLSAWVYGFLAGAAPFVISGELSPLQAMFEAVSGWTTTGLSVMDVSAAPKVFLFHRAFMQYCGGLGFVMVVLIFIQGKQAMSLFSAEGHADRLMPNLKKTAQIILLMYGGFTLLGTVIYSILGLSTLDAAIHAMCALSTGGFSTKMNSIGEYNGKAIEALTIALMLIGTTNFAVLLLFIKRKFKQLSKVSETRFMFGLLFITIPIIAWAFANIAGMKTASAFRHAAFNAISALSTTGFSTIDFNGLPQFSLGIFISLMLIGGGIGSTAGGIKMSRVYVLLRVMKQNLIKRMSPTRQIESPHYFRAQGKISIDAETVSETAGFALTYIAVFIIGALVLTLTADCTLLEAGFEFASALGTVGLSIGVTAADCGNATLATLILGMILGRLEIFIVIIGIYSGFRIAKEKTAQRCC